MARIRVPEFTGERLGRKDEAVRRCRVKSRKQCGVRFREGLLPFVLPKVSRDDGSGTKRPVNKCQSVLCDALRFSHLRVSKPPRLVKTMWPYPPECDRIGLGFVIYQAVHREGFLLIVE